MRESDTFVVRVFRGVDGGPTGLVQHVRTGERLAFRGLEALGEALERMTGVRRPNPPEAEGDPPGGEP